jgi:catechol 2,3-dioxygenase-like lactoylglutathione lyase family enzyme
MLNECNVHPTIAVSDITRAREFYEDVLELKIEKERPHEVLYASGNCRIEIYESGAAGTNEATYASWEVENVDKVVSDLKAKGVTFEHYADMEGMELKGDVHESGEWKAAWFRDPDGNFLCVSNEIS